MSVEKIVATVLRTPESVIHETNTGMVKSAKEIGTHFRVMARWGGAMLRHPIAVTRLVLLVGDTPSQQRDAFVAFGYKENPKAV